jgi:hypothetical protein
MGAKNKPTCAAVGNDPHVGYRRDMLTWSCKFAEPIALKDGRVVATLADAPTLLLALPKRIQLHTALGSQADHDGRENPKSDIQFRTPS